MRVAPKRLLWILLVVVVVMVIGYASIYRGSTNVSKDTVLRNDNFNSTTIHQILNDFKTSNVQQGKYVLTGGLGIANPRVDMVDNSGKMILITRDSGSVITFEQGVPNPANWLIQHESSTGFGIAEQGGGYGTRIPWIKQTTSNGQTYYEWNPHAGNTWFYFERNSVYMLLEVTSPGTEKYPFPQGVLTHLERYTYKTQQAE